MQRGHGLGSFIGGYTRSAMPLIKTGELALRKGALKTGLGMAGDVVSEQSIKSSANRRLKETFPVSLRRPEMMSKVLGSITHGPPGIRLVHRTIKRKPTRSMVSVARKRKR